MLCIFNLVRAYLIDVTNYEDSRLLNNCTAAFKIKTSNYAAHIAAIYMISLYLQKINLSLFYYTYAIEELIDYFQTFKYVSFLHLMTLI